MNSQQIPPYQEHSQSFDPNHERAGHGVDHHGSSPPDPFSYGAYNHGPFPYMRQHGPPAGPWGADFPWTFMQNVNDPRNGPWGGRPGPYSGRHSRGDVNPEDTPRTQTAPSEAERGEGSNTDEKEKSLDIKNTEGPKPAAVASEDDDEIYASDQPFTRRGGRGGRGGCRRGGGHFRGYPRAHHGVPPFTSGPHRGQSHPGAPPDFFGMMRSFTDHPFFRDLQDQVIRNFSSHPVDSNTFDPPVDIFNTDEAFVLHVSLPGAKKEDIGVNWNPETSVLSIAGVVHRPGDEAFLKTLTSGERKIGLFERKITLPPPGAAEKEDVDDLGITARMQDGILVITVPKMEKEWTEVRKVDIE